MPAPDPNNVNNAIALLNMANQIDTLGRSLATSKTFSFSVLKPYIIQSDKIKINGNVELATALGKAIGDALSAAYQDMVAKANALTSTTVPSAPAPTAQQVQ